MELLLLPIIVIASGLRLVKQYQRGVVLTLGKFTSIRQPGLRFIVPVIQSLQKVDIRTKVVDVPEQEAITRDNIPVRISAVVYYRLTDAARAILEVENFHWAVSQIAQTTMRNSVGEVSLDELLQSRSKISEKIKDEVDKVTDAWGVSVEALELKDIIIPEGLKRTISKEAEAERERRAVIIKAEGEKSAAENLSLAAQMLAKTPGALHLRTLQSINDISSDQSNTTIWMLPVETLEAIKGFAQNFAKNSK